MSDIDGACAWPLRYHYFCCACSWSAPQADFSEEPASCPRCGANPNGGNAWPDGTYKIPSHGWTCYHCGETFHSPGRAAEHFGASPEAQPGCFLKVGIGEERRLLATIREAEEQLARYRGEDTDLHRAVARMESEHGSALRCEEEKGYARGLRDERARCLRIIARIKAPIRNGGARNACDEIAHDIKDCRDA